jgi:hypothetical protein
MYPCLGEVRSKITKMVDTLFSKIPNLRIAIIAHGDYCDAGRPYTVKVMDFTNEKNTIVNFVNKVEPTGGGDAPECYELVLKTARTLLSWRSGTSKSIVMIGDDNPHGPTYPQNVDKIDWQNECGLLKEANVKVYGIHAMPGCRRHSETFYRAIAARTEGTYLTLDQFAAIEQLILGICYKQDSVEKLNEYVEVIKVGAGRSTLRNIAALTGTTFDEADYSKKHMPKGLVPVPSGRFQVFTVPSKMAIKQFVVDRGILFKKGRGFYELTKSETVQQYKEVILQDKITGEFYAGAAAREMLGLRPQIEGTSGGIHEKLRPVDLDKYRVFIQSTSVNRALVAGSGFLYEVEDWDKKGETLEVKETIPVVVGKTAKATAKAPTKATTKTPAKAPAKSRTKPTVVHAKITGFVVKIEDDGKINIANASGEKPFMTIAAEHNLASALRKIAEVGEFK